MTPSGQSKIVRFGLAVGALFALIGGPVSGYFLTRIFLEAKASVNWPSVVGTIIKVQVDQNEVAQYSAEVAYIYQIGDDEFMGSRIRASDGVYNNRDGAVQAIEGLAVGDEIPVFYNPSNPRQAMLRTGAGFQEYILLLVPIVMLGMGLRGVLVLRRTRHSQCEKPKDGEHTEGQNPTR